MSSCAIRHEEREGWLCRVESERRRTKEGGDELVETKVLRLVQTPFEVVGQVFKVEGDGYKFRCRGATSNGTLRTWFVPREATGDELLKLLAAQGAQTGVQRGVGQALLEYARAELEKPGAKVQEIVERVGWHTPPGYEPGEPIERAVFVFPNGETVNPRGDSLPLPELVTEGAPPFRRSEKGTVRDWVATVSPFIRGQRKGLLALSMAAFGAVGRLIPGASGLALVLTGASSRGKSTWLRVAQSFDGKPGEAQIAFNATTIGLESVLAQRRDFLISADEMTATDGDRVSALAYMMNGAGRIRANLQGGTRAIVNFFPVILGTSEASASAKMAELGRATTGGQEARLLCPDSDAGEGLGAFTTLDACGAPELEGWRALTAQERAEPENRSKWGKEYAHALAQASGAVYGAPGRAWRQWVADNPAAFFQRVAQEAEAFGAALDESARQRFREKHLSTVGMRVAARFALLFACLETANEALALELGSRADILTALIEEALAYADKQRFFDGEAEAVRYLEKLDAELSKSCHGHFQEIQRDPVTGEDQLGEVPRLPSWGFWDKRDPKRPLFLIPPPTFKSDFCFGMETQAALKVLAEAGLLKHDGELLGSGQPRFTLKAVVNGARERFRAIRSTALGGLWKADEAASAEEAATQATGNQLRDAAIAQNGGL